MQDTATFSSSYSLKQADVTGTRKWTRVRQAALTDAGEGVAYEHVDYASAAEAGADRDQSLMLIGDLADYAGIDAFGMLTEGLDSSGR